MIYSKEKIVRFSHCDPAGIGFYPRYVELCAEVVEDWFREALEVDFYRLHHELRLGVPTVRLEVEYLAPSTYGDVLAFNLRVEDIGNASMTIELSATCAGRERVKFGVKMVMMSLDSMRPVPIDEHWRARFSRYLAP